MLFIDCQYDAGNLLSYTGMVILDRIDPEEPERELRRFRSGDYEADLRAALEACTAEFAVSSPRVLHSVRRFREEHLGRPETEAERQMFEVLIGLAS